MPSRQVKAAAALDQMMNPVRWRRGAVLFLALAGCLAAGLAGAVPAHAQTCVIRYYWNTDGSPSWTGGQIGNGSRTTEPVPGRHIPTVGQNHRSPAAYIGCLDPELTRALLIRAAEEHVSVSEVIRRYCGQVSAGGSRDPGQVVAAGLVTLVPAARDLRLRNRPAAALT